MVIRKYKIISGSLKISQVVLLIAYCLSLIAVLSACGRRGDPVLVPSYDEKAVEEDKGKEEKDSIEAVPVSKEEIPAKEETAVVVPDAPTEVAAVHTGKSIVLVWKEVLKQGVTSYRIYRSSGEGYALAGETVSPAFTDRTIEKDKKYFYKITAVGQSESNPSEEITVVTESE